MRVTLGVDEQRDDLADGPRVEVVQTGSCGLGAEGVERVPGSGRLQADQVRFVDPGQPQCAIEGIPGGGTEVESFPQRLESRQSTDHRYRTIPNGARCCGERLGRSADNRPCGGVSPRGEDIGRERPQRGGIGELCRPGPRCTETRAGSVEQGGGRPAAVAGAQRGPQAGGTDPRATALVAQPWTPAVSGAQRAVDSDGQRHDAGTYDQDDARLSVQRTGMRDHGVAGDRDAIRRHRGQQRSTQCARRLRRRQRPRGAHDHLVDRCEFACDGQDRRLGSPHTCGRREPRCTRPDGPAAVRGGAAACLAEVDGEDRRTIRFMGHSLATSPEPTLASRAGSCGDPPLGNSRQLSLYQLSMN